MYGMRKQTGEHGRARLPEKGEHPFAHLKLLWGWGVYFVGFVLTERLIPPQDCYTVYCPLDDRIPFCEYFVIPYVLWYVLIVGSLVYFALRDADSFRKLQTYWMILLLSALVIFVIFPTKQELRPQVFPRDNFCTDLVGAIYAVDTNTGVCPSMHCALSVAMASVWVRNRQVGWGIKVFMVTAAVLICLSTVFIKQHSVVDFFAALPLCLLAEIILFAGKGKRGKGAEGTA